MNDVDLRPRWLVIGGAAAVVLGALLPWATVSAGFLTATKAGTEGDGVITLVLALIVGGLAFVKWKAGWGRGVVITFLLLGLLISLIAVIDTIDVATTSSDSEFIEVDASVGIGLWLTLLASIAMVVGAIWSLRSVTTSGSPTAPAGWTPPPPPPGYPTAPPQHPGQQAAPPSAMPTSPPVQQSPPAPPPPPPGPSDGTGYF